MNKQSMITKITKVFSSEKIFQQHFLLGHKIGLHLPEYELAIVINECESSTVELIMKQKNKRQ